MRKYIKRELPIRSKLQMIEHVGQILRFLHQGNRSQAEELIDDLKRHALYLSDEIQQDVLIFAEQIDFQYDYDPWHRITLDVTRAADRLIEGLGFHIKSG